jgi:formate hydrogenlyase subunit 3/multisubunit Na+/H+ antiporter MnhD subunit
MNGRLTLALTPQGYRLGMTLFLLGIGTLVAAGVGALLMGGNRWAGVVGAAGTVSGCALALIPSLQALLGGSVPSLDFPWSIPGGTLSVALDPLSGFFLVPTLTVAAVAAVYGTEYLATSPYARRAASSWLWYNLLVGSMALTLVAENTILFLLAWETMALASFFLVVFEHEEGSARRAGWTYLVATHLGTAALLVMFVVTADAVGSFALSDFARLAAARPALTGVLFLLAVVGFGTKAGFVPLHIWLPEAHPAAPSHVSAVMSGVMIKTGVYGLVRVLVLLGPPAAWWGWLLVGIGVTSGVLGVLFALAQHDLKRLLAYHSVENIGIIALGLGFGVVGLAEGMPAVAVLGFAGGLLHVLNHALFKGLLFLGAGCVLHTTGTREIDRLGGLLRRMPWTGACFMVGAAAIAGLPPLNGFVSEFLIYLAVFRGAVGATGAVGVIIPGLATIAALALIGGLAAACFTKAFGVVFLGEPRGLPAENAREVGPAMRMPMLFLASACVAVGLLPAMAIRALTPVLSLVARQPDTVAAGLLGETGQAVEMIGVAAGLLVAAILLAMLLRHRLLRHRAVETTVTWDCGYAQPTARMQYTASSFAQPLTTLFRLVLRTETHARPPAGLFPRQGALATETPDAFREAMFRPAFTAIAQALGRLRLLQHGRIQLYVLYVVLTLIALIAWKLG